MPRIRWSEGALATFSPWPAASTTKPTSRRCCDAGFLPRICYRHAHGQGRAPAVDRQRQRRRDPEGQLLGIRMAVIKATDRRRYEQELLSARETAVASEQAT